LPLSRSGRNGSRATLATHDASGDVSAMALSGTNASRIPASYSQVNSHKRY
jgi:hypothetical protein